MSEKEILDKIEKSAAQKKIPESIEPEQIKRDVYKRQALYCPTGYLELLCLQDRFVYLPEMPYRKVDLDKVCLLYTSRWILKERQPAVRSGSTGAH